MSFTYINLTTYFIHLRATICELCSKWGLCKVQPPSVENADNNQGETRNINTQISRNNLVASPIPCDNSDIERTVEIRSENNISIIQCSSDEKRPRFLGISRGARSLTSAFKVKRNRKERENIQLNPLNSMNSFDIVEGSVSNEHLQPINIDIDTRISNGPINVSQIRFSRSRLSLTDDIIRNIQTIENGM